MTGSVAFIESVVTRFFNGEFEIFETAEPDNTPWVTYASTDVAPASIRASAALHKVPPESIMSSINIQ